MTTFNFSSEIFQSEKQMNIFLGTELHQQVIQYICIEDRDKSLHTRKCYWEDVVLRFLTISNLACIQLFQLRLTAIVVSCTVDSHNMSAKERCNHNISLFKTMIIRLFSSFFRARIVHLIIVVVNLN